MLMSNRVGAMLSKPLLSRSALHRVCCRFASSTDARKTFILVIVDNTTDDQRNNDGFNELLGLNGSITHSPKFQFSGKGRPSVELQQRLKKALPSETELHKLLGSLISDSSNINESRQLRPIGDEDRERDADEWKVERVDSSKMLLEDVNVLFEKRFPAGKAVTVITLRPSSSTYQQQQQEKEVNDEELVEKAEEDDKDQNDEEGKLATRQNRHALQFVKVADTICAELQRLGFWSDFIDPRNGRPYRNQINAEEGENGGSATGGAWKQLLQGNDRKKMFCGLRISSTARAGKVIDKVEWKLGDFFGQIFTEAPANSWELQKIVFSHGAEFERKTEKQKTMKNSREKW